MKNEQWPWRPLGELFEIGAGKTMSASAREGKNKIPFLRTSNVFWDQIDLTSVDEMSLSQDELDEKSLRPGDMLLCEGGEIGRSAIWNGEINPISFQNHLHRLRPILPEVVPRFYVYFLQSAFTQLGIFEGVGNKTTIPNLSRNRVAALEVPSPPFLEQQGIARALAHIRSAIRQHEEAGKLVRELKRTAMHDLFARGLRGEPQKQTEIGPMPESWKIRSIKELCDIFSGGTPRKAIGEYWNGNIPWASGKDLKTPALKDTIDHISEEGVSAGSRVAPSDSVFLLVRGMGLAKDLPVSVALRPMAFNQDVKALVLRDTLSGVFLRSAIYNAKNRLLSRIVPSAHGTMTLNLDDIEAFLIGVSTDPTEVKEITNIVDALDQKIDLHKRKRGVLDTLFKALLHKVMTGEIHVSQLDFSALEMAKTQRALV
jgi:type I restriction enzyme S subunit